MISLQIDGVLVVSFIFPHSPSYLEAACIGNFPLAQVYSNDGGCLLFKGQNANEGFLDLQAAYVGILPVTSNQKVNQFRVL